MSGKPGTHVRSLSELLGELDQHSCMLVDQQYVLKERSGIVAMEALPIHDVFIQANAKMS